MQQKSFVLSRVEFDGHELVSFFADRQTGLRGYINIHNTNLGPAVGGTRFWRYASEAEALSDGLRLSRGMTYKCALARVPWGGGKAVIIDDGKKNKKEKMIAYARVLRLVSQSFFTGEDVGIGENDITVLMRRTPNIIGRPGVGGDPSPWAALGVFYALQPALAHVFGSSTLKGRTIAIKGLGKVGLALAQRVAREGGRVIGADVNRQTLDAARRAVPTITIVSPTTIHKERCDAYAPCAMGGELTLPRVSQLRTPIVCGSANNQLADPAAGLALHRAGILYIPDYLANAGGLINVVAELAPRGYSRAGVERKVKEIYSTADTIITLAEKKRLPTFQIADRIAQDIIAGHRSLSDNVSD